MFPPQYDPWQFNHAPLCLNHPERGTCNFGLYHCQVLSVLVIFLCLLINCIILFVDILKNTAAIYCNYIMAVRVINRFALSIWVDFLL